MTQLFIAGMEAVLPENFKCKSVIENPLFTKASDYTLDITLSLENPINARIYKHINRINSLSRFESREAMLVSDNEVVIKGIEILLSYTNKEVSIQIAAGNSSLNYLIGNDIELRSLNLGEAVINKSTITSNLELDYPAVDFQLLPFFDPDTEFLGNRYTYKKTGDWLDLKYAYDGNTDVIVYNFFYGLQGHPTMKGFDWSRIYINYENYRPQPFLGAIIRRIFEALGYTIENQIDNHDIYKYMYIVHAYDTLKFAEMLPNWTVQEFLEEVENLFDCTVIVDNNKMHARLVFNHSFYTNNEINLVMLDEFEVELEDSDEMMHNEKNIEYNLPDSEYYSMQNLPDNITRDKLIFPGGGSTELQRLNTLTNTIMNTTHKMVQQRGYQIYSTQDFLLTEYLRDGKIVPAIINDYKPLKNRDSESIDVSLNIIPAEFDIKKYFIREAASFEEKYYMLLQIPIARCVETPAISGKEDGQTIYPLVQDYIENNDLLINEDKSQEARSSMQVAFYKSNVKTGVNEGSGTILFQSMPTPYVRGILETPVTQTKEFWPTFYYFNSRLVNPLSLQFLNEEIYSKGENIDRTKIYKIKFVNDSKILDAKNIYIIGNRKFYCRKLERVISNTGFDEIIEGEFYAEKD